VNKHSFEDIDSRCKILAQVNSVMPSKPSAPNSIANNFAEEWRFHIDGNAVSQVNKNKSLEIIMVLED